MRFTRRWSARPPNRPWARCNVFFTTTCLRRGRLSACSSSTSSHPLIIWLDRVPAKIALPPTLPLVSGWYFLLRSLFSQPDTDVLALVSAEVGVVFCAIVLVTGPIWARPAWGIWWAPGDIRLTSTLVLWLIYVSYLVLRRFSSSGQT